MAYDIITIGSGLGGLLSSTLMAREGKKVLLLEQHSIPGGYCTSYKRNGFIFNIPSVFTNIMDGELYSTLNSLGLFDELEWVDVDNFAKYIYPDCEIVMPANDLDGCRENIKTAFPSDKSTVDKVFSEITRLRKNLSSFQQTGRSIREIISFVATIPKLILLSKKSFYNYLRKFTDNEKLITVLSSLWGYAGLPSKDIPAMLLLMMSGECYGNPTSFPRDGYQAVSDFLAGKFLEFGGEIKYRTSVSRILIEDSKAAGVETAAGEIFHARAVVSNADTKKTFLELVGRQNLPRRLALKVDAHTPSASGVSLHIGTNLDLSKFDLKYGNIFFYESWEDSNIFYDKSMNNSIDIEKDSIVLGMQASSLLSDRFAPEGMNTLHICLYPLHHGYFRIKDGVRGEEYSEIKDQLADILIRKVEKLIPGLSGSILVKELSTPYTFERYTGASDGAWYDSVSSTSQRFQRPSSETPIEHLYLTGTKAFGGAGMSSALRGGIETAKVILKK